MNQQNKLFLTGYEKTKGTKMNKTEFEKVIEKHLPFFEDRITRNWDTEMLMRSFAHDLLSIPVEKLVKPEIVDTLKKMEQEYSRWLTLPRYQAEGSNEYYADIQAITEHLQTLIDKIK